MTERATDRLNDIKFQEHQKFEYSTEQQKLKDDSTELEMKRTSGVSVSGINLDKQYENENPEIIADNQYDEEVTCATPFKYVKQKWCFRRKRQVRYKVSNQQLQQFDERRLIDCRFWLFIGTVSNCLFQLQSTFKPLTPEQLNTNYVYWVNWFVIVGCLFYSFKKIRIVVFGLILHTIRNIVPLYDFEKRKSHMDQNNWNILIVFQVLVSCFNMLLLNNTMDRGFLFLGLGLTVLTYYGILNAFFGNDENQSIQKVTAQATLFSFSTIIVVMFMYIQKRIHKEVFMEIKQRVSQQDEFKTIFNQLDEGIIIMEDQTITQVNTIFKKFVSQYFNNNIMMNVAQCNELYEESQNIKVNKQENKLKTKFIKCFNYITCWRDNRNNQKVFSQEEKENIQGAEVTILNQKMFKVHLTKAQKQQLESKQSQGSFGNDSLVDIQKLSNPLLNPEIKDKMCLGQLITYKSSKLEPMCFQIINPNSIEKEESDIGDDDRQIDNGQVKHYIQIKKKNYIKNGVQKTMIQMIDVSQSILYEQVHAENQFLAITNATVSHELRNPLQSISAQNIKVSLCLKELMNIIKTQSSSTVKAASKNLQSVIDMIQTSNKIQESSSNMMSFLVDDLLDFAQLNAGKFRKVVKKFDLKEAIDEIVQIQKDKASMGGIKLNYQYIPQPLEEDKIVSLFNRKTNMKLQPPKSNKNESDSDDELFNYDFALINKDLKKDFNPKTKIMVETDKRRLQQIILNIQSNALKFTDEGGEVTVYYSVYNKGGKSYAEVQVKDNGMGIKRKDKAKLFKLFGFVQSTDDVNTRGIGLGLVISKKIAECFDGQIGFKSKWQKGSTFGFSFCLSNVVDQESLNTEIQKEKQELIAQVELENMSDLADTENDNGEQDLDMLIFGNPELPGNILQHLPQINQQRNQNYGKIEQEIFDDEDTVREDNEPTFERVMVVDDEPFNIDALKIVLQCATADIPNFNFKNRVDTASNGQKAVELLKKNYQDGFSYKLILMDCNMPKMDGYVATDLIRKFIADAGMAQPYIVAISGHVEEKYVQRALAAGMNSLISKPAKVEDVREATQNVVFS